jgi:hypothetical protein
MRIHEIGLESSTSAKADFLCYSTMFRCSLHNGLNVVVHVHTARLGGISIEQCVEVTPSHLLDRVPASDVSRHNADLHSLARQGTTEGLAFLPCAPWTYKMSNCPYHCFDKVQYRHLWLT